MAVGAGGGQETKGSPQCSGNCRKSRLRPKRFSIIGPLPITNSLLLSIISGIIVITFFLLATRNPKLIPRPLQNLIEWMTQGLLNICEEVAGRENGRRFFKWVAAIFFLVLVANWWSVIPGIGTIGVKNTEIPGCEGVNESTRSSSPAPTRTATRRSCARPRPT